MHKGKSGKCGWRGGKERNFYFMWKVVMSFFFRCIINLAAVWGLTWRRKQKAGWPVSRDDESLTKRGAMGMESRGQIWKICGICEWLYVKVVEEPDMFRLQILAGVALWMIVAQGDRKYRKYWGQGWSFSLGLNELVIEVWHWWAVRCISRESSGEETWPQVKAWKSLLAHWCYLESPE